MFVIAPLLPLHFLCVSSCFGRDRTLKARCCPTPFQSSVLIGHLLCSLATLSNEPLFTVHTGPADRVCHVLRLLFLWNDELDTHCSDVGTSGSHLDLALENKRGTLQTVNV
jgi:hypothetical protein